MPMTPGRILRRAACQLGGLLLACLLLGGCVTQRPLASGPLDADESQQALNQGYTLLHTLMADQSNLDMILMLKSPSPTTRQLVRHIAELCRGVRGELASWSQADPTLSFNGDGLPLVEQNARIAMGNESARVLLASSGDNFELRLLLTQDSATGYAAAVARQLAQLDDNPERSSRLTEIAEQFTALNQRVLDRLALSRSER
jgi:hypothetical protein